MRLALAPMSCGVPVPIDVILVQLAAAAAASLRSRVIGPARDAG
jgi:hypothetical protein